MTEKIITEAITKQELKDIASERFGDMVKAVVDVERAVMALGGELHSDEEALLLENGSKQNNLWGINLYPNLPEGQWVEFDSMINLRPGQNNSSRSVEDKQIRKKITLIVGSLIKET